MASEEMIVDNVEEVVVCRGDLERAFQKMVEMQGGNPKQGDLKEASEYMFSYLQSHGDRYLKGIQAEVRAKIETVTEGLVTEFLYYDRKEDEYLPEGVIQKAIEDGVITVEEIIEIFSKTLRVSL